MLYLQFYTPNCNFTISQKTKKIVPCLGLLQNKSCVCVGGILWIQGHTKNGPAMVFLGGNFANCSHESLQKFQPDTPVYISSKKAFYIFHEMGGGRYYVGESG